MMDSTVDRTCISTVSMTFTKRCIRDNAIRVQSQESFDNRYSELDTRFKSAEAKLARLKAEKIWQNNRKQEIKRFISSMQSCPLSDAWDDRAWMLLLEKSIVLADGGIEFVCRNGMNIKVGGALNKYSIIKTKTAYLFSFKVNNHCICYSTAYKEDSSKLFRLIS